MGVQVRRSIPGFSVGGSSRSRLEAALDRLKALQGIEELKSGLAHRVRAGRELLGLLDGESYPVHGHTSLESHLEFNG
jgi:hypothetical protein